MNGDIAKAEALLWIGERFSRRLGLREWGVE
jgi:hypothetical protein